MYEAPSTVAWIPENIYIYRTERCFWRSSVRRRPPLNVNKGGGETFFPRKKRSDSGGLRSSQKAKGKTLFAFTFLWRAAWYVESRFLTVWIRYMVWGNKKMKKWKLQKQDVAKLFFFLLAIWNKVYSENIRITNIATESRGSDDRL